MLGKLLKTLLLAVILLSCSVDKNSEKIADSTNSMQTYIQRLEEHIANLDKAFFLLITEFKSLNGDIGKLADVAPELKSFILKFENLESNTPSPGPDQPPFNPDELDGDTAADTRKDDPVIYQDVELAPLFDKLNDLKQKIEKLDPGSEKTKEIKYKINSLLDEAYFNSLEVLLKVQAE